MSVSGRLGPTIEAANAALFEDGRLEAVDEYFAPDYVVHTTGTDLGGGRAVVRRFVDLIRAAFSDLDVDVEILVDSGDRVSWQRTVSGTQDGPFMGFPATGRRIVWRDMVVSRFHGDRIAEEWAVSDLAEHLLRAGKGGRDEA